LAGTDDTLGEGRPLRQWAHRFKVSVTEDTPIGGAYAVKKRDCARDARLSARRCYFGFTRRG